jgi:hypothetical protein
VVIILANLLCSSVGLGMIVESMDGRVNRSIGSMGGGCTEAGMGMIRQKHWMASRRSARPRPHLCAGLCYNATL